MVTVRTVVRRCWLLIQLRSGPPMPFAVSCECGGGVSGMRRPWHQILSCPICRKPLFVLPFSRWPPPEGPATARQAMRLRTWRMPLLAGICTLVIVAVAFLVLTPFLLRQKPDTNGASPNAADEIHQRQAKAQRELFEGNYHQAFADFDAAKELSGLYPNALSRDERIHLDQLHRQSDVLARLLSVPLQEIVGDASRAQEKDWQGRSVMFDDRLRADLNGRLTLLTYEVRVGQEKVRLALEDLRVLRLVPVEQSPRVLLGARLAKVAREAGGWVIRFEPDSGVLFTDQDAARVVPLDDELLNVLERQKEWLRQSSEPQ